MQRALFSGMSYSRCPLPFTSRTINKKDRRSYLLPWLHYTSSPTRKTVSGRMDWQVAAHLAPETAAGDCEGESGTGGCSGLSKPYRNGTGNQNVIVK